jgi:hypothetical protein
VETTSTQENAQGLVALASFQQLLLAVVESSAAIDIRGFELANVPRLMAELRPAVSKLLAEGRSLVGSLLDVCDMLQRPSEPADHAKQDGGERVASFAAIEQMAFMAQLELGQRAERLERVLPNCDAATLLGECDSSLRRLRKSLNAVGLAISGALGVAPLAEYRSELESSLAIRRALKSFRVRVNKGGEPAPDKLRDRFRYISNQIEILVSWDIYSGMRVRDRLLLRGLQQRLLAWLNGANATPEAGMRIWGDLVACVEMFALVNRRQELVEHDAALFDASLDALSKQAPELPVDDALWRRLRAVEGLDLELDALIEQRQAPRGQALAPIIERLAARASPPPQETPAPSDPSELW